MQFGRPDDAERDALLRRSLSGVGISDKEMQALVRLTGAVDGRPYGCTYSDLRQQLIPMAILQAVETGDPITGRQLIEVARTFRPTRPFDAELGSLE